MNEQIDLTIYADPDGNFNPILFAESILGNFTIKTAKDNEIVYIYDEEKGVYSPDGEAKIKTAMANMLGKENRHRYYPDVIFHIKAKTYFERPSTVNPLKLIVANGVLNVETRQLVPFNPAEFYLTALPVYYDEKAECPVIIKFLSEVVGKKLLPLIQEMFGYCLYQDYLFHVAFMFVGNGKNGKSTLINLLTIFLGKESVSHETLQDICYNRFSKAQLYGKLANTCADIPSTPLTYTGIFKIVTGNDSLSAEYKFKNPFIFINKAKLIFSCNQVPETKDDTDAYYRRWQIIPCNNTFKNEECDPNILAKLTIPEELSGLLNWALEGLKRLLEKRQFSINEDFEEQRRQYIRKSNSSKAFIEESLSYDPDHNSFIPESELYQKYIAFCNDNELPSSKKAVLTQNIHQYLAQAKQTMERIDGKATHVWQYIHCEVVTTVTTSLIKEGFHDNYKLCLDQAPVTPVTNSEESLVAGHCKKFHTGACSFPGDPNCLTPLNPCVKTCKDFEEVKP